MTSDLDSEKFAGPDKFVILSQRQRCCPPPEYFLIEDFLDRGLKSGLLVCGDSWHAATLITHLEIHLSLRKRSNGEAWVFNRTTKRFSHGGRTLDVLVTSGEELHPQMRGRRYPWVGVYSITTYPEHLLEELMRCIWHNEGVVRGVTDSGSMPLGVWVQEWE